MEKINQGSNFAEKITPSIFAADFKNLKDEVNKIVSFGCKYIHLDIMDGHFVPNISYGPKVTEDILRISNLEGDLHLMVQDPSFFIDKFMFDKISYVTFHYESYDSKDIILKVIQKIKKFNKRVGISIKPATKVNEIVPILKMLDLVLIMTVEPGFSGQKMIVEALSKIEELDSIRKKEGYSFLIEVDGGINFENASLIIDKGADLLVLGSAFFC